MRLDSCLRRRPAPLPANTRALDSWCNASFFDTPFVAFQAFSLLSMQMLNPPDGGLIRRDCWDSASSINLHSAALNYDSSSGLSSTPRSLLCPTYIQGLAVCHSPPREGITQSIRLSGQDYIRTHTASGRAKSSYFFFIIIILMLLRQNTMAAKRRWI